MENRISPVEGEKGQVDVILERQAMAEGSLQSLEENGQFMLPGSESDWGSISYWRAVADGLRKKHDFHSGSAQKAEHLADVLQLTIEGTANGIRKQSVLDLKQEIEQEYTSANLKKAA